MNIMLEATRNQKVHVQKPLAGVHSPSELWRLHRKRTAGIHAEVGNWVLYL